MGFEITGLNYRDFPYKVLYLRTKIDGIKYDLTAIPSKNFRELFEKAKKWDELQPSSETEAKK